MDKIRTVIVDDEPLARRKLRTFLAREPDFEVAGECGSGAKAVSLVEREMPDLLFLDVQMPGLDGFGVLSGLKPESLPAVIFVTAFDEYAVKAFEVNALDYLLKPFDRERFQATLRRARAKLRGEGRRHVTEQILALLRSHRTAPAYGDRIAVKSSGRVRLLKTSEIDWVESADNYVRIHMGKESFLLRETLSALAARLDPGTFTRIHRSTLVNLERVKELKPWFHGEYLVLLRDGTELTLSRRHREAAAKRLGL